MPSKSFQLKGLRERRGDIKRAVEQISDRCERENRAMTEGERKDFDKLKSDDRLLAEQERHLEDAIPIHPLRSLIGKGDYYGGPSDDDTEAHGSREARALSFQAWARTQNGMGLTERHQAALRQTGVDPRAGEFCFRLQDVSKRSLSVGTGSAGGYTVAQDFSSALEIALVSQSALRGVADEIRTDTGADMPYPKEDDTGNTGEQLAENTEVAYADPVFSSVTLGAYKYSSKAILISNELLQDSAFELERILGDTMGTRIGKIQGSKFTTGSGSSEPMGVVTAATAGLTTASATAATGVELTKLIHSVDPSYRNSPKFGLMMHDSVIAYFLNLLDSNGRPLLRESFKDGANGQLMFCGVPVYVNQYMESTVGGVLVTAKKHVLAGDFSKMKIRDAGPVRFLKLDQRWAEKDQTGFIGFLRSDQRCVNTSAIHYMLQA